MGLKSLQFALSLIALIFLTAKAESDNFGGDEQVLKLLNEDEIELIYRNDTTLDKSFFMVVCYLEDINCRSVEKELVGAL